MIPEMTDPLGKHWRQPRNIRSAPMDANLVLLTRKQFVDLPEYSTSMPSGVYPGKCWKRMEVKDPRRRPGPANPWKWLLVWYGIADDPKLCSIEFREIRIGKLKGESSR